jgi:hypothetical protein
VREQQNNQVDANVVLIEDKASGCRVAAARRQAGLRRPKTCT